MNSQHSTTTYALIVYMEEEGTQVIHFNTLAHAIEASELFKGDPSTKHLEIAAILH